MFKNISNRMSMRRQFSITFILLILLPIILLNLFLSFIQVERFSNTYATNNKYAVSDIPDILVEDFEFAFSFANVVYNDYDINMFLNTRFKDNNDFFEKYSQYSIKKILDFYANQSNNIMSPEIYTDNSTMRGETVNIMKITDSVKNQDWYKSFIESGTNTSIYFDKDSNTVSAIRRLDLNTSSQNMNLIRIPISLDALNESLTETDLDLTAYIYSDNSSPLYTWENGYEPMESPQYYAQLDSDLLSRDLALVFSRDIDYYGNLRFVVVIPKVSFYDKDLMMSMALTLCLTLFMSLLFMRSMEKNYIKRIEGLVTNLNINEFIENSLNEGNTPTATKLGNNELSIVEDTIENMSGQIHNLIKEAYTLEMEKNQAQIRQKQSELNSLLSQINPHYLFNVLNAIRLKCILKGEKETAKIILYVSKIFRQSITWNTDVITLNEELNFIKEYLFIEKYRFEDKLTYEINIDDSLLMCEIPKMCLQPFVENACVHGVQNSISEGKITIDVENIDENRYSFTIKNPVVDFSQQIKEQIIGYSKGNFNIDTKSVGLKNTFARLRHYYNDFDFNIIETDDCHVSFVLTLNKVTTKRNEKN